MQFVLTNPNKGYACFCEDKTWRRCAKTDSRVKKYKNKGAAVSASKRHGDMIKVSECQA